MTRFEKWSVWLTSVLTALTGFGYTWTKYFMHTDDPWAVVNHPLEPWFLKLHVVVAPLFMFAIGLIAIRHVWKHIATGVRQARRSGLTMVLVLLPMVATGYLIQVVTHRGWLRAMAISHIAFGVLYVLGMAAHQAVLGARVRGAPDVEASRRETSAAEEPPCEPVCAPEGRRGEGAGQGRGARRPERAAHF
ncbi:MAG: hypothetical protein ACE5JR_05355 [Gemmatimonadota bacterium]